MATKKKNVNEELHFNDEDVRVLKGLDGIRERWGMYAGTDPVNQMISEVIDNSIDEYMNGFGNVIKIWINTKKNKYTIRDYGRGVPLGIHPIEKKPTMEVLFTTLHAGGKFDKTTVKTSGGLHGIGTKICSACSSYVSYESYRKKDGKKDKYEMGSMVIKHGKITKPYKREDAPSNCKNTGLKVTFIPDEELFKDRIGEESCRVDIEKLKEMLKIKAYINKGLKIQLMIDGDKENKIEFYSKYGISEYINTFNKKPFNNMSTLLFDGQEENGDSYEIALSYGVENTETILGFVNSIKVRTGYYETGFKQGLTRAINEFIKNNNLLNKKEDKLTIDGEDVRRGLICIISMKISDPIYQGQTKDELGNKEFRTIINSAVYDNVTNFLNTNPDLGKALCKRIIAFAKATNTTKEAIKKITKISSNSMGLQVNEKFKDCELDDPEIVEIFVVEGNSAGGTAEGARFGAFQCVFPLRGKIKNVKNASFNTLISNKEINDFLKVEFGTNDIKYIRSQLQLILAREIDKVKLFIKSHKIIIMCDADEDGRICCHHKIF